MIYANEWDAQAAHWLTCLPIRIDRVDGRSICEIKGSEIDQYTQCHFFAGIGGWPLALEIAGWPTVAPVWTGSCPCQPFSSAGKRKGTSDDRHLWPEFRRLIDECRPSTVFGEQVAGKAGRNWLATVRADLEALGYAVGAADLCAAGVGAPHIRQRLFWVAYRGCARLEKWAEQFARCQREATERSGDVDRVGITNSIGSVRRATVGSEISIETPSAYDGMADTEISSCGMQHDVCQRQSGVSKGSRMGNAMCSRLKQNHFAINTRHSSTASRPWANTDFIECRDGKARPVKPGVCCLANGVSGRVAVVRPRQECQSEIQETRLISRVAALKGLGNATVPQVAAEFIGAFMDTRRTKLGVSFGRLEHDQRRVSDPNLDDPNDSQRISIEARR